MSENTLPELVLSTDAVTEMAGDATAIAATEPAEIEVAPENTLDYQKLSPEEKKLIDDFVTKINITDSSALVQYGAPAQNKIAQFSDNVLKNVRNKDLGEAGQLLTSLVTRIRDFDAEASEKKGIFAIFHNAKKQMENMLVQYNKVEANIDTICTNLEGHKRTMLKDVAMFDQMYQTNLSYFKELSLYIIAGEQKIKELKEVILPEMERQAAASEDSTEAQKLQDARQFVQRFEKKIHDLKLSRMISIQMGPQIRLIQNNDTELVDKIQSSLVNSIPLWKNQIVIALGLYNAKQAMEANKQVTDMTNELLKKNSKMLKQGSIEIAQESERGIVDLETLRQTNQDLIETISEVLRIQREGSEKRAIAEAELMKIEGQLKSALIEAKQQNVQ